MKVRCDHANITAGCTNCLHNIPHSPGRGCVAGAMCSEAGREKVKCIPMEDSVSTETKETIPAIPAELAHQGDPCQHCGVGHNDVAPGPCPGRTPYQPPEIDMIPVESSNIVSVGHDGKETLRVEFKSGRYDYVGVTEERFFEMVNADSVGKAYGKFTKECGIKGIKLQEAV